MDSDHRTPFCWPAGVVASPFGGADPLSKKVEHADSRSSRLMVRTIRNPSLGFSVLGIVSFVPAPDVNLLGSVQGWRR